jgi:MFS family permease
LLATYRSILREPGALRLVITALLARIPVGINALAVVLLVRRATGSFADAGVVDAGLAIGAALISPTQGRLVDRFGQTKILIPSALVSAGALIGLVVGVHHHVSIAVLTALAAIGGGTQPPMSASMRALWASLIPEPARRNTAFALEAVLTEVYFIAGPLITAVIVAVSNPSVAVIASASLSVAGTLAFATSRASRMWRAAKARRTFAGALAGRGMRTLVLSVAPMGLAFGTLEVAMPALATQDGDPAAAGILLGAFAGGSLLGGLLYGSRSWPGSSAQRYVFLTAVFAAGMAPLIVAGSIPVMVVLMAVAGLTLAPVAACSFALIEDVAPTGTTIEAFTWLFTANMAGAALGAAAAGAVIHSAGIRAALLIPLCGVAVSFLLALAGRRALASGGERATGSDASSVAGGPDGPGDAHGRIGAEVAVRSPRASGRHGRVGGPRFLAAGLILVAALLGYRARDGRSDSHRRSRRR